MQYKRGMPDDIEEWTKMSENVRTEKLCEWRMLAFGGKRMLLLLQIFYLLTAASECYKFCLQRQDYNYSYSTFSGRTMKN